MGIVIYFEGAVIFIYFVPQDSPYFRDESLSEFFNILKRIEQAGKVGFIIGDHNEEWSKVISIINQNAWK